MKGNDEGGEYHDFLIATNKYATKIINNSAKSSDAPCGVSNAGTNYD